VSDLSRIELSGEDVVVARLTGEIDLSNAADVRDQLSGSVTNSALGMVVDLTATSYLDSSGVHLLFELGERLRRRQQQLCVVVPEGVPIRRVLKIVELDSSVPVLATVDEAAERIRSQA
jgi:anti-anti-sigma factor